MYILILFANIRKLRIIITTLPNLLLLKRDNSFIMSFPQLKLRLEFYTFLTVTLEPRHLIWKPQTLGEIFTNGEEKLMDMKKDIPILLYYVPTHKGLITIFFIVDQKKSNDWLINSEDNLWQGSKGEKQSLSVRLPLTYSKRMEGCA